MIRRMIQIIDEKKKYNLGNLNLGFNEKKKGKRWIVGSYVPFNQGLQ